MRRMTVSILPTALMVLRRIVENNYPLIYLSLYPSILFREDNEIVQNKILVANEFC